jgi:hypothetical protein
LYVDLAAKKPDQMFWLRFEKRLVSTATKDHHRGALKADDSDESDDDAHNRVWLSSVTAKRTSDRSMSSPKPMNISCGVNLDAASCGTLTTSPTHFFKSSKARRLAGTSSE